MQPSQKTLRSVHPCYHIINGAWQNEEAFLTLCNWEVSERVWVSLTRVVMLLPCRAVLIFRAKRAALGASLSERGNAELTCGLSVGNSSMETKTLSVLWGDEKVQTKVTWDFVFLSSRAIMFRNILCIFSNLTLFNKCAQVCKALFCRT